MAPRKSPEPERRSARDRLLAAADTLFYEGGIHAVGIDRVIELAGVAKASLYGSFGSKDELVRAYLQARHDARKARLLAKLERYTNPRDRLLGVFDVMAESMAEPGFRGCAFARAGSEARPSVGIQQVCDDARGWMRELFKQLAADAGARAPEVLARQLVLLYDGAAVSALMEGGVASAAAAREAAALMLDAGSAAPASTAAKAPRRASAAPAKTRRRPAG